MDFFKKKPKHWDQANSVLVPLETSMHCSQKAMPLRLFTLLLSSQTNSWDEMGKKRGRLISGGSGWEAAAQHTDPFAVTGLGTLRLQRGKARAPSLTAQCEPSHYNTQPWSGAARNNKAVWDGRRGVKGTCIPEPLHYRTAFKQNFISTSSHTR